MPRTIPVACIQLRAGERAAFARSWPHALEMLRSAAQAGAKLIVAPEGTVPSYVIGSRPVDPALVTRAAADVSEIAKQFGCIIVYGTVRHLGERAYNSAAVIGPAGPLGASEKRFLWHFDRKWFAPGTSLEPVPAPLGKLGVFVCADGRIPTIARALADRGSEILIVPTAWVTSGRNAAALENIQADLLARVRAIENGVPLAAANKVGTELRGVAYCGKSTIVAADGTLLAQGPERDEAILSANVELGGVEPPPRAGDLSFPAVDATGTPVAALPGIRGPHPAGARPARIAISPLREASRLAEISEYLAVSGADVFLAPGAPDAAYGPAPVALARLPARATIETGGVTLTVVDDAVADPGALPPWRLRGRDLFVWHSSRIDPERQTALARARAAELRSYVIVIDERAPGRAYAADPDGTILAGTFDGYDVATFLYEPSRSAQTAAAPETDVLDGLRAIEALLHTPAGTPG
jgi:predicted amidohydrolase